MMKGVPRYEVRDPGLVRERATRVLRLRNNGEPCSVVEEAFFHPLPHSVVGEGGVRVLVRFKHHSGLDCLAFQGHLNRARTC